MPFRYAAVLFLVVAALAACQSDGTPPQKNEPASQPELPSSAGVPPVRGFVGEKARAPAKAKTHQTPAPPVGGGSLIATCLGASLPDAGDRAEAARAEKRAATAQLNQMVTWANPANGHKGTLYAARDSYADNGAYCRDFEVSVSVGPAPQKASCRACQAGDGAWKVLP